MKRYSLITLILCHLVSVNASDFSTRPLGMDALAHLEYLPFYYPTGTQTLQYSSYDPAGGNGDGDFKTAFTKYVDSNGEYVIFDAYGPGCLCRQHFNARWVYEVQAGMPRLLPIGMHDTRVRYYFDNEQIPRIDMPLDDFFGAKGADFGAPFSFTGDFKDYDELTRRVVAGGSGPSFTAQYYPILFAKRLKVSLVPGKELRRAIGNNLLAYYQFTYHLYPPDTRLASWRQHIPSEKAARNVLNAVGADRKPSAGNQDAQATVTVAPGKSAALLDVQGQGAIANLNLRLSPYSEETFYGVRIRMIWDLPIPEPEHSIAALPVDMPIGSFFGGGSPEFSTRSQLPGMKLANLLYGFDGTRGTFYSYWPMPYWKSARIEIVNDSSTPVTITAAIGLRSKEEFVYPVGKAGYFFAKRTRDADTGDGLYATEFNEWGFGHIVGTNFFSQNYCWEGDEMTYLDGSRSPQIHGNGTEDDHNQGFGGTTYQQPLWGALLNGYKGAYRLYINDSYVFNRHVKVTHESHACGGTSSKTDVVIYYYKSDIGGPNPKYGSLIESDVLDVGIDRSEKAHDYTVVGQTWAASVRSSYDGYDKNPSAGEFLEEGRAFKGHSAFTVAVHPRNDGVRLRRLTARSGNSLQIAEVRVDGVKVARPWLVLANSATPESQSWIDSEFELPASLTRGKSKLRIEVRYLDSAAGEINEFHYWVFSHLPQ